MANYKKVKSNNLAFEITEVLRMLVNVVDGLQQRIEILENGEVRTQASTDAEFSGEVF